MLGCHLTKAWRLGDSFFQFQVDITSGDMLSGYTTPTVIALKGRDSWTGLYTRSTEYSLVTVTVADCCFVTFMKRSNYRITPNVNWLYVNLQCLKSTSSKFFGSVQWGPEGIAFNMPSILALANFISTITMNCIEDNGIQILFWVIQWMCHYYQCTNKTLLNTAIESIFPVIVLTSSPDTGDNST